MWDLHRRVQQTMADIGPEAALAMLAAETDPAVPLADPLSTLAAECHLAQGRPAAAIALLQAAVARGTDNFWVYYNLAVAQRTAGDIAGAVVSTRHAHAVHGWPQSLRHGYVFTHDSFSANIPNWRGWFASHITAAPIACLEIGSWQGGSATWLLDHIVGPRGGRLTCVDTFAGSSEHIAWLDRLEEPIEAIFDANIARTGRATQCRKLVGRSQDVLPTLFGDLFDFIYIDGANEAKFVILDAMLCWGLLKPGGFLLFDDAHFTFAHAPAQNTNTAITAFRTWFADEIEVLTPPEASQLLVRRLPA